MDSQQVRNLQEAYIGVYDGDIREKLEFESWVNNLLEEGYDLSDYTWDELYESYFNEAQYTPPQQIQQPAAEVRKAPNKNTQNPAVPVLTGLALAKLGNEISKKKRKKGPDVKGVFEEWVTGLLDEGYDLSDYTWDEMYEIYNEDYKGGPAFGMKYSKPKPLSGEKGDGSGYGGDEKFTKPDDKIEKPGTTVPPFKKGGYGRIMSNIPHGIGDHRDKIQSRISTIIGKDPGAPTSQKMTPKEKKKNLEIIRKKKIQDSYDLYDTILSHLMNEGYADTIESAERIMVNMSEDWRESICEANRGDEYATRGMSPEASKTWKSERRNRTSGFSSDVEEKRRNDERYKKKYGKPPLPDPDHMGGSQRRRQADTKDNRGKRTTLTHTTSDTLSPSGIKGTVTKPEIKIGTPLGGTQNPEPKGKYLHRQQVKDAQSPDPTKRARAPQNYLYHMN